MSVDAITERSPGAQPSTSKWRLWRRWLLGALSTANLFRFLTGSLQQLLA